MASDFEVVPIPEGNARGHETGKTIALRALASGEALRVPVDGSAPQRQRQRWCSVARAAFGGGNYGTSTRDGYLYIWRKDTTK